MWLAISKHFYLNRLLRASLLIKGFQYLCWGQRLLVFMLRPTAFELISSMRLDSRKNIQSLKSAGSVLYAEPKVHILSPLQEINRGQKYKVPCPVTTFLSDLNFFNSVKWSCYQKCKPHSLEQYKSLRVSFSNIQGYQCNDVACELSLNQTLQIFFLYVRRGFVKLIF